MKTSRVTRRVVRRWGLRVRQAGYGDLVLFLRLTMPSRDRETTTQIGRWEQR